MNNHDDPHRDLIGYRGRSSTTFTTYTCFIFHKFHHNAKGTMFDAAKVATLITSTTCATFPGCFGHRSVVYGDGGCKTFICLSFLFTTFSTFATLAIVTTSTIFAASTTLTIGPNILNNRMRL